jgi:hypothetical protein
MLAGNYANSALSASDLTTTNLFQDELGEMVRVHDRERVAIAVRTAIRTVKRFLPEVAVIWELIPPAPDRPRFDPSCGKCGGTGWKYLPAATGSPTRVDRCNCAPMRARSA